jgi:hypothetical protein
VDGVAYFLLDLLVHRDRTCRLVRQTVVALLVGMLSAMRPERPWVAYVDA